MCKLMRGNTIYSVDHRPTRGRLTKKSEDVGWGGSPTHPKSMYT